MSPRKPRSRSSQKERVAITESLSARVDVPDGEEARIRITGLAEGAGEGGGAAVARTFEICEQERGWCICEPGVTDSPITVRDTCFWPTSGDAQLALEHLMLVLGLNVPEEG